MLHNQLQKSSISKIYLKKNYKNHPHQFMYYYAKCICIYSKCANMHRYYSYANLPCNTLILYSYREIYNLRE